MKTPLFLVLLLLAATVAQAAAPQAVVKEVAGKVELMPPAQGWIAARPGMTVSTGTVVSTGFNSTAVLELGASVLQVKPLTRLRLEELLEREGTVQTDLFLRVGKVRAEIKTVAGLQQDFKLRSPVSTAAVRGTGFEYSGYELYVFDGQVRYSSLTGQQRTYGQGEEGETSGYDTPSPGEDAQQSASSVNPYAAGAGGESGSRLPPGKAGGGTGSVTVVVGSPQLPE